MSKMMIIIKREYLEVVQKKSFLLGILAMPVLMAIGIFLPTVIMQNTVSPTQNYVFIDFDNASIGDDIKAELLTMQTDDDNPQFAFGATERFSQDDQTNWNRRKEELSVQVQNGELDGVLVLFPNIVQAESLIVISKTFDIQVLRGAERKITNIISAERLKLANINLSGDSLAALTKRVDIEVISPAGNTKNFQSTFFGMMIYAMVMFMLIFNYGQVLMRSVIEEKTTRIMEVMVSSVSPFQLMMGKILGLGAAAFTQVAIWAIIGAGLRFGIGSDTINAGAIDFVDALMNPITVSFFFVFLVIGFLLYSTLFAAIGSMVNTDKDAQNFMMPVVMVFVLPFMLAPAMASSADSAWAVTLSLIPFTAPSIMTMRLALAAPETFTLADPVILQSLISIVLMILATIGMIWLTGRIFRIGVLMYGKRPTLPEIVRWVRKA